MSRGAGLAFRWGWVAAYTAFIFFLSSQSELPAPPGDIPFFDKYEHVLAYGMLGLLLSLALRATFPRLGPLGLLLLAMAAGSAYGATDELHQSFVPNRSSDPRDWAADTLGSFLGAALHAAWRYRKVRRAALLNGGRDVHLGDAPEGREDGRLAP